MTTKQQANPPREFAPRMLKRPKLCPVCRVNVWLWPCVKCHGAKAKTSGGLINANDGS